MVIAPGFRVRPELDFVELLNHGKGKRIKEKLEEGAIDQNQAVNEALKVRSYVDTTPELQANFAMAKAFIADASGSAADWILFDDFVDWEEKGMSARFGRFKGIDEKKAGKDKHEGILDAFEIAKAIGASTDIVDRLRDTRLGNLR